MATEEKPPVIERALWMFGKKMESVQVEATKRVVIMRFLFKNLDSLFYLHLRRYLIFAI